MRGGGHLIDGDADQLVDTGVDHFQGSGAGHGSSDSSVAHLGVARRELGIDHHHLWTSADLFGCLTRVGRELVHLGEHLRPYPDALLDLPSDQLRRIPQAFSAPARRPPG